LGATEAPEAARAEAVVGQQVFWPDTWSAGVSPNDTEF
jgi:hypothetical protein